VDLVDRVVRWRTVICVNLSPFNPGEFRGCGSFVVRVAMRAGLLRLFFLRLGLGELTSRSPLQTADEGELIPTGRSANRFALVHGAPVRYYFV
jgi:hypothetical protein